MTMITSKQECDLAVKDLDLKGTISAEFQFGNRAHGCLIRELSHGGNYLLWAPPELHPHDNVPCGTWSGKFRYNCICANYGKINFLLIKHK